MNNRYSLQYPTALALSNDSFAPSSYDYAHAYLLDPTDGIPREMAKNKKEARQFLRFTEAFLTPGEYSILSNQSELKYPKDFVLVHRGTEFPVRTARDFVLAADALVSRLDQRGQRCLFDTSCLSSGPYILIATLEKANHSWFVDAVPVALKWWRERGYDYFRPSHHFHARYQPSHLHGSLSRTYSTNPNFHELLQESFLAIELLSNVPDAEDSSSTV